MTEHIIYKMKARNCVANLEGNDSEIYQPLFIITHIQRERPNTNTITSVINQASIIAPFMHRIQRLGPAMVQNSTMKFWLAGSTVYAAIFRPEWCVGVAEDQKI